MSNKIKPEYTPMTIDGKLGSLVEECGEVLAAAGKTIRCGSDSFNWNPELPEEKQETNKEWLLRGLVDLERAIRVIKKAFREAKF